VVDPVPSGSDRVTVPHLNRDPVWSLRPWPVTVRMAHTEWTIPALPATDWLAVLMSESIDPDDILPGLLNDDEAFALEELLSQGVLSIPEVYDTCTDIIEKVSGRNWWVALRLIFIARESWDNVGAELILRRVDANTLSLSAWLDALFLTLLKTMDPKQVPMFTMQLEAPPEGEKAPEQVFEMTAEAFLSMG